MAGGEGNFGYLSDHTFLPSSFGPILNLADHDYHDDLLFHIVNDSFPPQQTDITHGAVFPSSNDSFAPSIEPILEIILQETEVTLDELFSPTIIAPSIEPIPVMIPQETEISPSLPEVVDNINSGVVTSAMHGDEVKQLDEENKVHKSVKPKRKYELKQRNLKRFRLFLEGYEKYVVEEKTFKKWKKISKEFVVSKTPTEVGSHAQKFKLHQKKGAGKRPRWSIHDIAVPE
ncbi:hypothetical protein AAC387_Pa04g2089 [Persea americana]